MGSDQVIHGERRASGFSPSSPVATYQTRICDYEGMARIDGDHALSAYTQLYGHVERKLFAEIAAGRSAASLKSYYLKRYQITARMFKGGAGVTGREAPAGNGVCVASTAPVRKRVKHVWTYWGAISRQLRPALAAQHRLERRRRRPKPVQALMRASARGVA